MIGLEIIRHDGAHTFRIGPVKKVNFVAGDGFSLKLFFLALKCTFDLAVLDEVDPLNHEVVQRLPAEWLRDFQLQTELDHLTERGLGLAEDAVENVGVVVVQRTIDPEAVFLLNSVVHFTFLWKFKIDLRI